MSHLFGHLPDGRPVHRLVLGGAPGVEVHLLTLGATIHRLVLTGGDGQRRDVALGYGTVAEYLAGGDYLGGTVGRYANRIAHGHARVDGREVQLETNDRGHHLHGGPDGFHRRLWEVRAEGPDHAHLALVSPAGDAGHPGELEAHAHLAVTPGALRLALEATTDAATLVNLTSHVYLNLAGVDAGTVDDHLLRVPASAYTPVDTGSIPGRGHDRVEGTPFDLRQPRRLGDVVGAAHPQVAAAGGIDHNLVVDGTGERLLATLAAPATQTRMDLTADQPGLQVYTGGALPRPRSGVALEPQHFPDSPHHPEWPSAVLRPGETYRSTMTWSFGATR